MDIIFGRENAEKLREKYTVLDLETVEKDGQSIEVFCLLSAEKIGFNELPTLDKWVQLHNDLLHGFNTKQYSYCKDAIGHLKGKFAGELDSFYNEILRRIEEKDAEV